jgi:hypothetical protein
MRDTFGLLTVAGPRTAAVISYGSGVAAALGYRSVNALAA